MSIKNLKKAVCILLAVILVSGVFPMQLFAAGLTGGDFIRHEPNREALEFAQMTSRHRGLFGFVGDYALGQQNEPTDIIVVFENMPAAVQVALATEQNQFIPFGFAEIQAEGDHILFRDEIAKLFDFGRGRTDYPGQEYTLHWEYRVAINGVAMTVPAGMVHEIANFESVRAIFPSTTFSVPDPIIPIGRTASGDRFLGMDPGRARMNADIMHQLGYTGEGVLIAVLDTGIDYHHPAFRGTFPTIEEMLGRGAFHLTEDNLIYVYDGYYYIGRDFVRTQGQRNPNLNSPMETSPINFPNVPPSMLTMHGTHVAGTIAGQDTGGENAILGVAPGAKMIHYRVLGFGGSGSEMDILAAVEWAVDRDGADIVNMSLGSDPLLPWGPMILGINNLAMTNGTVFVIAAGNEGPGFFSAGDPAIASRSIAVGSLSEDDYTGLVLGFDNNVQIQAPLLILGMERGWQQSPYGNIVSVSPRAIHEQGVYRIFPMPLSPNSAYSEWGGGNAHVPLGAGTPADFNLLFETFDEEDLQGAFVLVRRGHYFTLLMNYAISRGLGGIITTNAPNTPLIDDGIMPGIDPFFPYLMISYECGWELINLFPTSQYHAITFMGNGGTILTADGLLGTEQTIQIGLKDPMTFEFLEFYGQRQLRMADYSSRGPVLMTYEIKPDVGAHGTGVYSAVPWWSIGAGIGEYYNAFLPATGTSMAAPHVAGAAAILMQFGRDNHGVTWRYDVIKTRLMNNTTQVDSHYGIFETGAGQIDVYRAAFATTVVFAEYGYAFWGLLPPIWGERPETSFTMTGSFSFGGLDLTQELDYSRTIWAFIENHSDQTRSYTISYSFIETGPLSRPPAGNINFSLNTTSITVPPGEMGFFNATMTMLYMAQPGHYEGHIIISYTEEGVTNRIYLPFAGVAKHYLEPIANVTLYNPVISTTPNPLNPAVGMLGLYFDHYGAFFGEARISLRTDTGELWPIYQAGFLDLPFFPEYLGQRRHGLIFDFGQIGTSTRLLDGGRFYLEFAAFRPDELFIPEDRVFALPFYVDNTPPQLAVEVIAPTDGNDIIVRGNVYDAWLSKTDLTFDIWDTIDPHSEHFTIEANNQFIGLWVYVSGREPVRLDVDPNGDFETILVDAYHHPTEIVVWALDNYSMTPRRDAWFDAFVGNTYVEWQATNHFVPHGLMNDTRFPDFVWRGLNVTEYRYSIGSSYLSFDLGGTAQAPTTPTQIAPIQIQPGILILDFLAGYEGFPEITRAGFGLAGWYFDQSFTLKVTRQDRMPAYDLEIFARWTIPSLVHFELGQGTQPSFIPSILVPRDVPILEFLQHHPQFPNVITREGYMFMGWYLRENFTMPITTETRMLQHEITIFARWERNVAPWLSGLPEDGSPMEFNIWHRDDLELLVSLGSGAYRATRINGVFLDGEPLVPHLWIPFEIGGGFVGYHFGLAIPGSVLLMGLELGEIREVTVVFDDIHTTAITFTISTTDTLDPNRLTITTNPIITWPTRSGEYGGEIQFEAYGMLAPDGQQFVYWGLHGLWGMDPYAREPIGLTIDQHTGLLSGIPLEYGYFQFWVSVTYLGEAMDPNRVPEPMIFHDLRVFLYIPQGDAVVSRPVITTPHNLNEILWEDLVVGGSAWIFLEAKDSLTGEFITGYLDWSIVAGNPPPGLGFNDPWSPSTLVGTPEEIGIFVFTVRAVNPTGYYDEREFTLAVVEGQPPPPPQPPTFPSYFDGLPDGVVGEEYEWWWNFGTTAVWTATGLPPGLIYIFDSWGGWLDILGTPEVAGEFPVTIRGENEAGYVEEIHYLTIHSNGNGDRSLEYYYPEYYTIEYDYAINTVSTLGTVNALGTVSALSSVGAVSTVSALGATGDFNIQVRPGHSIGIHLPTAFRFNYTFAGWNTAQDGSGVAITANTPITSDLTLYAQWVPRVVPGQQMLTIENNPPGAVVSQTPSGMQNVGSVVNLVVGTRAGFSFAGWTSPQVNITNNSFAMPNTPVTVTANWTPVQQLPPRPPTPPTVPPQQYPPLAAPPWSPSLVPPAVAPVFVDLSATGWYVGYVNRAAAMGLFQGIAPGLFAPHLTMTRAMFAQVLANIEAISPADFANRTPTFADVANDAWYFAAVEWAASEGIVLGIGENRFAPIQNITREQMAAMLYRFINAMDITLETSGTTTAFTDQNQISDWAIDAVATIQAAGIILGHADGRFAPQDTATRAEVAAMFVRFLELFE